jgi:hypothetical protein
VGFSPIATAYRILDNVISYVLQAPVDIESKPDNKGYNFHQHKSFGYDAQDSVEPRLLFHHIAHSVLPFIPSF